MYPENDITTLRTDLLEMVSHQLTPVAMRYGYSEVPLETNIKWRPLVLVLGNYSSGKSTLINEFLGIEVQATGQAPTDDSFTIITCDENEPEGTPIRVTDHRDGKFLLNDPEYPFEMLKRHGLRFAAHFKLKKVNSPFLKNLAIIDTPGMLDSISERDRGYNYQEVIGDLAQIADLVLVLFDPHKAGTVREAHTSLRDILPTKTFEDRVLYVLNRIDECASMTDLLRVYGTLCWNLSQITGRKDIPMIHLTYSSVEAEKNRRVDDPQAAYLQHLKNQRDDVKKAVLHAPCHRLDNLATFVEVHGERLAHFLEGMISFRKRFRKFRIKSFFTALGGSLVIGAAVWMALFILTPYAGFPFLIQGGSVGLLIAILFIIWMTVIQKYMDDRFMKKCLSQLDLLTPLPNQTRKDSWASIHDLLQSTLTRNKGNYNLSQVMAEYAAVKEIQEQGSREIREALKELNAISLDGSAPLSCPFWAIPADAPDAAKPDAVKNEETH
ncbi:dynamin family protein [Desulfosarcina sp. OttesenSCG-928-A07]|nr:dynamin family protein [Desulfosarcina sp. OttesenSCG-928-A07]